MRAWLNLRYSVPKRRETFHRGLERLGYQVIDDTTYEPEAGDIFITWNRIGVGHRVAEVFESRGLQVLVTENAAWGNGFADERWYSLAKTRHNTSGLFPIGGHERWDDLHMPLADFRTTGETIILPQRGIGARPTAMPSGWAARAQAKHGGRIRAHPGTRPCKPLEDDLANCGKVITWGSGAAVKALIMGIPVFSAMPNWIGEQDNTEADRLAMFRQMAWAQWRLSELGSGEAFARMLD